MFVLVTENTRVFSDVDETADEVDGELYDGSFVRTANVRVEEVRQDGMGRTWLLVRYLYGEEEPDGEMAWTDTATVWVLAEETRPSDAADYDVTAYAFPFTPVELYAADTPPRLQTLSGNTGEFYAGQTVYAYSVHDDVQIASLKNYGAIYATQHYINEHVVYCLEHTMNSPGIRNNSDGPYKSSIWRSTGRRRVTPASYTAKRRCTPSAGCCGTRFLSWGLTVTRMNA